MKSLIFFILFLTQVSALQHSPSHFGDVKKAIPNIEIEIRYATKYNFTGKPVSGYLSNTCYLQKKVIQQLKKVQADLQKNELSLKVYDCYRPQKAVDQFVRWSQKKTSNTMKSIFFPNIHKKDLFKKKYLAKHSKHSKGYAVDVTLVKLKDSPSIIYYDSDPKKCTITSKWPKGENTLEMGTTYDCLDSQSATESKDIQPTALANRLILKKFMTRHGFKNYSKEWWHYTLPAAKSETYYNFDIK